MSRLTYEQLEEVIEKAHQKRTAIIRSKNHDYTNGSKDLFANFRASEVLEINPEIGILLRVIDKIKRCQTFFSKKTLLVEGEGILDSLDDIQNYIDLIRGLLEERRRNGEMESGIRKSRYSDDGGASERILRGTTSDQGPTSQGL